MFWNLIIGLALMIIGYLIMPKPKAATPTQMQELEGPTASGAQPIIKIFGDLTIKSPNILWYGNIRNARREKKSNKK